MPDNILIVGTTHDLEAKRVVGNKSAQMFRETIEPRLTSKSLILVEGWSQGSLIRSGHPHYPRIIQHLGLTPDARPTLCGVDPRGDMYSSKFTNVREDMLEWSLVSRRLFGIGRQTMMPIFSFEKLREQVRNPDAYTELQYLPTRREAELARWWRDQNDRFDRRYLAAIKRYSSRFDICVMVAGSVHALSIWNKENYPLELLITTEEISSRYLGYLMDYVWPTIVSDYYL